MLEAITGKSPQAQTVLILIMESDEAFPNSKYIFMQAFAAQAQDPAPLLLQIIKDHPAMISYSTIPKQWKTTLQDIVENLSHPLLPGSEIPQMHLPSKTTHSEQFSLTSWRAITSKSYMTLVTLVKCKVSKTNTSSTRSYLDFRSSTTYLCRLI